MSNQKNKENLLGRGSYAEHFLTKVFPYKKKNTTLITNGKLSVRQVSEKLTSRYILCTGFIWTSSITIPPLVNILSDFSKNFGGQKWHRDWWQNPCHSTRFVHHKALEFAIEEHVDAYLRASGVRSVGKTIIASTCPNLLGRRYLLFCGLGRNMKIRYVPRFPSSYFSACFRSSLLFAKQRVGIKNVELARYTHSGRKF